MFTRRTRAASGLASVVLLGGLLAGCGGAAESSTPPVPPASVGTHLNAPMAASVMSLPVTDEQGRTIRLGDLDNQVVVLYPAMTTCAADCPLDTANIVTAARAVDAAGLSKKVTFLSLTIDPGQDTPRRMTAFRKLYAAPGQLPNWNLVTGSQQDIAAIWKYLGVYFKKVPIDEQPAPKDWLTGKPLTYDIEHADEVFLLDGRGRERFVISGHANVPDRGAIPAKLRGFLDEQGNQHLNHPGFGSWTPSDVLQAVSWLTGREVTLHH